MESKADVFANLIRTCRMMRMAPDVSRARAALDVEQDLMELMRKQGLALPEPATPTRRRRNRRSSAEIAAVTAGGAA